MTQMKEKKKERRGKRSFPKLRNETGKDADSIYIFSRMFIQRERESERETQR